MRIGVYICHCGHNIAGGVEVTEVARWASDLRDVACVTWRFRAITSSCAPVWDRS
jgi:heterodisulfide reductase subunit A-like polyferredoxin